MTLPAMQFHDRTGARINLSSVETRESISTAKLCHVIDVGEGVWCRPCQSDDCAHAEQVEHVLRAAELGDVETDEDVRVTLPRIARINRYLAVSETIAACWFENGARLRYHEQDDGQVRQVVFAPGDTRRPAETTPCPDADCAERCLVDALADYCDYRRDGDLDGLRRERPALAVVVGDVEVEVDEVIGG